MTKAEKEHRWFETIQESPRDLLGRPFFLQKLEPSVLREIEGIDITGPCEVRINEFGIRRGVMGKVKLIWGSVKFLDEDALVVATEDEKGAGWITVAAQPKKRKPLGKKAASKRKKRSP